MKTSSLTTLAMCLFASGARAEPPPVSVSIGYASEVFSSRGYDLVDDDDHLPMFRLGAGWTLLPGTGLLDVEAAFHVGSTAQTAHQQLTAELGLVGLEAGASWRYPLYRYLQPYGRLGAGWDWATLSLNGAKQTVSHIAGNAGAGIQVPFSLSRNDDKHAPAIVLEFGAGYVLRPGFGFHALEAPESATPPEDPIARRALDVGTLPLSGISYRILATFRL